MLTAKNEGTEARNHPYRTPHPQNAISYPMRITHVEARDIRFPTSRMLDGSDAVNVDPDYSAAYVTLRTDQDGLEGNGLAFTCGRGTEIVVAMIRAFAPLVEGLTLDEIRDDMLGFWRRLTSDSQMRWLGPEKGVIHLATAAITNAVWDLLARCDEKPLWQYLLDMPVETLVECIEFRYVTDLITPEEATYMLRSLEPSRASRLHHLRKNGYPAYTTSAGWLGYSDEKLRNLCREGVANGWTRFKQKVGVNVEDDRRRARIIREEIGEDGILMMDANQYWDVDEAIRHMNRLREFDPYWIEEPTSPDDVLGHAAIARALRPIRVATGEHAQNRVLFKQFLQAEAIGVCQIDACRLGGVNEVLAVLLMAAKCGVPVCPHAGGVGLCEYVQHLSIFDYVAVSGHLEHRVLEYVDHLHEHFVHPVTIKDGNYVVPETPGYSIAMHPASLNQYEYPGGAAWKE